MKFPCALHISLRAEGTCDADVPSTATDAWEAVPEDVMEDMEYSDLTRALEGTAAMPQGQGPTLDTKDPIQGTIAGMPSVVRRTMDFLGFRRSQEVAVADAMVGLLHIPTAYSASSSMMPAACHLSDQVMPLCKTDYLEHG